MRCPVRGLFDRAPIGGQDHADLLAKVRKTVELHHINRFFKPQCHAGVAVAKGRKGYHLALERLAQISPCHMLAKRQRGRDIAQFGMQRVPVAQTMLACDQVQTLTMGQILTFGRKCLFQLFCLRFERVK